MNINNNENEIEKSHDLDGVTKISTPLFILFTFLTLGIYQIVKCYRMTGDLRKIVNKEETVSPLTITSYFIVCFCASFLNPDTSIKKAILSSEKIEIIAYFCLVFITVMLLFAASILLYIHIVFHTINNIRQIALIKQNKDLKYNKFWAFLFGFIYINFVFNTYEQRLTDKNI